MAIITFVSVPNRSTGRQVDVCVCVTWTRRSKIRLRHPYLETYQKNEVIANTSVFVKSLTPIGICTI